MNKKQLPCPFCGGTPKLRQDSGDYGYTPPMAWVQCDCGVTGPKYSEKAEWRAGKWVPTNDPLAQAVAAWNRRC